MSRWKIVLSLVAVFVAGMVVGGTLTFRLAHQYLLRPPSAQEAAKHMMDELRSDLDLSAEQVTKLEPIVAQSATKAEAVHHEMHARFEEIFQEFDREVAEQLTDEQKAKFEKFKARRPRPPEHK